MRQRGWIVPAYTLPKNAEDRAIMRIVIRLTLSREQINILYKDLIDACEGLERDIDYVLEEAKNKEEIGDSRQYL